MKKSYFKFKMYAVAFCLFSLRSAAQLSGIVTIDNTAPSSATNYTSFTAFAAVINTAGVNGPLTVNVNASSNTYTEQVELKAITGTSATNTITLNGNGATITFSATAAAMPCTFLMSGTDYVTVNNLNIIGTGATYALALHLWNGADNNSFNTCTVTVPSNNTSQTNVPVSVNGSSINATATGVNVNNVWTGCTMKGGWFGISFYGPTTTPYMNSNKVINCKINDFADSGIMQQGGTDQVFRGNTIERPTRSVVPTSGQGIYIGSTPCLRTIVEGNWIRNPFAATQATTATFYGMQLVSSATAGNELIIRNNIISDCVSNGPLYGIYNTGYNNMMLIHNTFSFDHTGSTATGATYGIYMRGGPNTIKNNIVTITRGGNGTKYCFDYGTIATQLSDANVFYINAAAGTNNYGYFNAAVANLTALKALNNGLYDQNSSDVDPMYSAPPTNYAPGNILINNMGSALGVITDFNGSNRSLASPDPGAIEFFNTPCANTPPSSTITSPTLSYCPNTPVNLSMLASTYTNSGYTYQWLSSTTSSLGPWTPVTGATLTTLRTPSTVNMSSYYTVSVSCLNSSSFINTAVLVNMLPNTVSSVPYLESFEALNNQVKLPNCSWAVSNSVTALTQTISNPNGRLPRTGSNFAMFTNSTPGVNYFYTNGISMVPGITYSASLYYLTESVGYTNWTDLSILVGSNQSATSQSLIVSTNGAAVSPVHKLLSGTFTVDAAGVYYVAIRATSTSGSAVYLSWDDLKISIPCSHNSPTLALNAPASTICEGNEITITASGADTYTWATGETVASITVTPHETTIYTVTATNALSGCSATLSKNVTVLPSPVTFISADKNEVCQDAPVMLTALGTGSLVYSWSTGGTTPYITVNPHTTTTYSLFVINASGCSGMDVKQIKVNPLPSVSAVVSANQICRNEKVTLTGSGADTYNWNSNTSVVYLGNPLVITLQSSVVFTLTGTDANGCSNKSYHTIAVNECTGLLSHSTDGSSLKLYPNPADKAFTLETGSTAEKNIVLTDLSGRIVLTQTTHADTLQVNMEHLAGGVYYLKVMGEKSQEVIKVIKTH